MTSLSVRGLRKGFATAVSVALCVGGLGWPTDLRAQHAEGGPQPLMWDGIRPHPNDLAKPQASQFGLTGLADFAMFGMRGRGTMIHNLGNDGPIDYYFVLSSSIVTELNTPTGSSQIFFMGPLWAGTPRTEWLKHRTAVPSLNNVLGGGWTSQWNVNAFFLRLPNMWRPADGQLGIVHAGVSATDDGTCTDFTGDFVDVGTPLNAVSDCPPTWGSEQFAGASRRIEFEGWADYFNTVGPLAFDWDWWRVPPEFVSDRLIGDFQSYGTIVDWAADNLARFGNVIPGGSGAPQAQGFPLGLTIKWDAFSFQNPDVANVTYWRAMIINDSEKVYGVPLDYDSLYFGNQLGWLFGPQNVAMYFRPEIGAVLAQVNGANPNCNNAIIVSGVNGCTFGPDGGFNRGAAAVIVLNSPIGDLRNKLFSDSTSPFFAPGHPRAGDTITFNHGRMCGFGGCWANTTNRSARSGFGLYASIPVDVLDGRSEADFDALGTTAWWRTFRNYDYPNRTAQFNRWVPPGNWDYNKDGIPDTLYLDTCLGPEFGAPGTGGCSEPWSDTMPGRLNNAYSNFGGFIGAGPFRLAAGDTTRWTIAIVTGGSRAAIEANVRNAIGLYMRAWLQPEPAPPPNIVAVDVTPGDRGRTPGASVSIFIDDVTEEWEDVFLLLQASQIAGTQLDADNPWLVDSIRRVARNNVAAIHVFKTCDFGTSFTADADCFGDPAVDAQGNPVGLGWRPLVTMTPDEDGRFPNVFVDQAVTAGKTYVYTFVAETRGFRANVVGRDDANNPIAQELVLAPALFNPLSVSVSDPNVARVYVPASRQAGARGSSVSFTQDDPVVTVEYHPVQVILTGDVSTTARYRVVFGDSVVVTQKIVRETGDAASATVQLFRTVLTSTDGGNTLVRAAYDSATYVSDLPAGVNVAGGTTTEVVGADTVTRTTVYAAGTLALVALDASDRPLFTSSVLDGTGTTPGTFLGRPDFPRWLLAVDNTSAGRFASSTWFEQVRADSAAPLRALGAPSVGWLQEQAIPTGAGFGELVFEFVDYEYGPAQLFQLDLLNPANTQAAFDASLAQRAVGTTTATTPEVAAAIGVAVDELAAVNLPFRVRHAFPDRPVTVAMLKSAKRDSITLGSGEDQIRVAVPADQWVPGEPVVLLETIRTFQRATGPAGEYVVTSGGQPVVVDTLLVTFSSAVLGCADRSTCNPLVPRTRGASRTAHLPVQPNTQFLQVRYYNPITPQTSYEFEVERAIAGADVTDVTATDLENIKVVPNPYVVFSQYEQRLGDRRLMFTGLPPRGTIEIYTVSGQFVQRITYTEEDLAGNGDLFWNMRTRENTDIASGLYVFVVRGELPASGRKVQKVGKFVVIR